MHGTDIGASGIDVLTVYLIREEVEVVFLDKVANLVHLPAGIEISGRVVGVADQDGACALVDKLFELLDLRQGEAFFYRSGNGTYLGTCRDGECHIVSIGRFGHDDLVARIEAAHE